MERAKLFIITLALLAYNEFASFGSRAVGFSHYASLHAAIRFPTSQGADIRVSSNKIIGHETSAYTTASSGYKKIHFPVIFSWREKKNVLLEYIIP